MYLNVRIIEHKRTYNKAVQCSTWNTLTKWKPGLLPLRQLSHRLGNLRQPGIGGAAPQPQFVIDGGSAAYHGSGGNVVRDAALRYGYGSVAYFFVAAYAYLSGQDYVVAYFGGAGQAYLGADERVVAYGAAVAYVDEVV